MSLLLYLAQEGRATTHRDTGLEKQDSPRQSESRAANLKKKRKKKREGDSWVTGVHQASRKQLTAQGLGPKEAGSGLLSEKLTGGRGSGEGREREGWMSDFDLVSEGLMQFLTSYSIPSFICLTPRL